MDIGILIISHGEFAKEMVNTLFTILGTQDKIDSVSIGNEVSLDAVYKRVKDKIDLMKVDKALLLTDIIGGTPCNVSLLLSKNHENIYIISGVNLPMLITAATFRTQTENIEEYLEKIISTGRNNIVDVKQKFINRLKEG